MVYLSGPLRKQYYTPLYIECGQVCYRGGCNTHLRPYQLNFMLLGLEDFRKEVIR